MNGLDGGDLVSLEALSDAEWVADLVDRLQRREPIDVEAYIVQYPDREAKLRRILPALRMLTSLAPGRSDEDLGATSDSSVCLGDYRTIRVIGRGGMGVVYEAVQISLNRRVALKILPTVSAADPRRLRRFHVEAQAAACLQHPHIVPVYSVGFDSGIHYFAMRLIEGRTLAELIRESVPRSGTGGQPPAHQVKPARSLSSDHRSSAPEEMGVATCSDSVDPKIVVSYPRQWDETAAYFRVLAELGRQAAEALQFAHEQGVLHRDVKPSNLLIDESGWLWMADFGLARMAGEGDLTSSGDLLGTLRYMSPEQVLNPRGNIDHRADIYSLGATLYEMVTRRPAFAEDDRLLLIRKIVEDEPRAPRSIDATIPRDLETIILKAMAKDRSERYATASALAADLLRFNEQRPIQARPPRVRDRLLKWGRRHQLAVALLGVILLLGGGGLATALTWRNRLLRAYNEELQYTLNLVRRHATAANEQRLLAESHEWATRRLFYGSQMRRAQEEAVSGRIEFAQEILEGLRPQENERDARGFEWYYLHRFCHKKVSLLFGHDSAVYALGVSPDGRTMVSGDYDGTLIVWDLPEWRQRLRIRGHSLPITGVTFSPDGLTVASWTSEGGPRNQAKLWDVRSGRELLALSGIIGGFASLAFSPLGHELALAVRSEDGTRGRIQFWNLSRGAESAQLLAESVPGDCVAYAPDGQTLASGLRQGPVNLRDVRSHKQRLALTPSSRESDFTIHGFAFAPDGGSIVAATSSGMVRWDTKSGRETGFVGLRESVSLAYSSPPSAPSASSCHVNPEVLPRLLPVAPATPWHLSIPGNPGLFQYGALSSRGLLLAVRRLDSPLTLWNMTSGKKVDEFPDALRGMGGILFEPGERSIIFGGEDGRIRAWHIVEGPEPTAMIPGHSGEVWGLVYTSDGNTIISSGDDHVIRIWDAWSGRPLGVLKGHDSLVASVAVSKETQVLASAGFDKTVRLWRLPDGEPLAVLRGHTDRVRALAFSPDGRYLASASSDKSVRVWEVSRGHMVLKHQRHLGSVRALAFDPGGTFLISSGDDRTIRGTRVESGREIFSIHCPNKHAALAFSPDGSTFASGDDKGYITLWNVGAWTQNSSFKGADAEIFGLAFSPDGRTLAAGCGDANVRLCDPGTGQVMLVLSGHSQRVNAVAFSPTGKTLATSDHEGIIRIWHGALASEPSRKPE